MMQVLQALGLTEMDGDLKCQRDSVPSDFVSLEPSDIMQHSDEQQATPPYACERGASNKCLSAASQRCAPLDVHDRLADAGYLTAGHLSGSQGVLCAKQIPAAGE